MDSGYSDSDLENKSFPNLSSNQDTFSIEMDGSEEGKKKKYKFGDKTKNIMKKYKEKK